MLAELQRIAEEKGGTVLSTSYVSPVDQISWKCKNNHEWSASLLSVMHGAWCAGCYFNDQDNINPIESSFSIIPKKYYYLYKVTNIQNQKIYIGVHGTEDLKDGYMGSGKYLKNAIKKHGSEYFKIDILEFFNEYKEALAREKQIVTREFIEKTNTYNRAEGGHGGFIPKNAGSLIKISKANKGKVLILDSQGNTKKNK